MRGWLSRIAQPLTGGRKRRVLLLLVLGIVAAAIVFRSWIGAQARAVVVMSTAIDTPVLTWAVKGLTDEPRLEESTVAGVPTTVARPGAGDGPWPTLVLVNGATAQGRHDPDVKALAAGLARSGHLVFVPDLPGLREGMITDATLQATVDVARLASSRPDAEHGQIGLVGVSVGASLALLAAEDPVIGARISVVSGIAPYTDLAEVIRLATTGRYRDDGRLLPYAADPFVGVAVARSLAASLPSGRDRDTLVREALTIDRNSDEPLATFRSRRTDDLGRDGRAVVELLANQDPAEFDRLYAALSEVVRLGVEELSPLHGSDRLRTDVELASAPVDRYFPPAESEALVQAAPTVRLTITDAFAHAIPRPSFRNPGDLLRFNGWALRSLRAARREVRGREGLRWSQTPPAPEAGGQVLLGRARTEASRPEGTRTAIQAPSATTSAIQPNASPA